VSLSEIVRFLASLSHQARKISCFGRVSQLRPGHFLHRLLFFLSRLGYPLRRIGSLAGISTQIGLLERGLQLPCFRYCTTVSNPMGAPKGARNNPAGRTPKPDERRIAICVRLSPDCSAWIKEQAEALNCTATEILERAIQSVMRRKR
jgi:hypothetical protein